jgi:hypothetical protein
VPDCAERRLKNGQHWQKKRRQIDFSFVLLRPEALKFKFQLQSDITFGSFTATVVARCATAESINIYANINVSRFGGYVYRQLEIQAAGGLQSTDFQLRNRRRKGEEEEWKDIKKNETEYRQKLSFPPLFHTLCASAIIIICTILFEL